MKPYAKSGIFAGKDYLSNGGGQKRKSLSADHSGERINGIVKQLEQVL
jgi:hypothetical protein